MRALRGGWLSTIFVVVCVLLGLVGIQSAVQRSIPALRGFPWIVVGGVAFAVIWFIGRQHETRRRTDAALQHTSPDAVARVWYSSLRRVRTQWVPPLVTLGQAQLCAIYGDFERAEALLGSVEWDKQFPWARGQHEWVRAIIAHLKGNDDEGWERAQRVPALLDLPPWWPGAKARKLSEDALRALSMTLALNDRAAAARLAALPVKEGQALGRALSAWVLARAHSRWGNDAEAARWLAVSRRLAPHAYGLGVPRPEPRQHVPTVDPNNPYAAPADIAPVDDQPFVFTPAPKPAVSSRTVLILWAALIAAFFVIYTMVARSR